MDDHRLQLLHSSGDCNHRTPPELYSRLRQTFPFDLDLAATAESALVTVTPRITDPEDVPREEYAVYLGPDHPNPTLRDSLVVQWHQMGWMGFLNPPYSLSKYKEGLDAGVERADLQWLLIENWAKKAYEESLLGFYTVGVFPYAAQTKWFRRYVMGHQVQTFQGKHGEVTEEGWAGHAALDYWRIPHRVSFLTAQGKPSNNSNINTCIVLWGPNPGWVGPWEPTGRYWSFR